MKNFSGIIFLLAVMVMAFLASCANNYTVRYPFGPAEFEAIDGDTTVSLTVKNGLTFFTVSELVQETTVNATPSSDLPEGSMLYLRMTADTSGQNVLGNTNFECDTITITASKTVVAQFIWDGDNFVHLGTQQID